MNGVTCFVSLYDALAAVPQYPGARLAPNRSNSSCRSPKYQAVIWKFHFAGATASDKELELCGRLGSSWPMPVSSESGVTELITRDHRKVCCPESRTQRPSLA